MSSWQSLDPHWPLRLIVVLWPSFVTAIVATGLFFSAFHPEDLRPFNIELSNLSAYSLGFFGFWLLAMISSAGSLYFCIVNSAKPFKPADRT